MKNTGKHTVQAIALAGLCAVPIVTASEVAASQSNQQSSGVINFAVSTIRLPNGTSLTTKFRGRNTAKWEDVVINLELLGANPQDPYGQSLVGNHSQILSQQYVSTPNGKAWFALNERTPPAAAHSTKITYEYWVAIERQSANPKWSGSVDYCIEATVIGNRAKAKQEILNLIRSWKVPKQA